MNGIILTLEQIMQLESEIERLKAENAELRTDRERIMEAISPSRVGVKPIGYFIAVAKRMRDRQLEIFPLDPSDCTRDPGHDGPCNGYPRQDCAIDPARPGGQHA